MTIWFLMAFQAGAINAGGFISSHRFVSHTTGFATHFGAEFASENWSAAISMASVPLFFLLGTMISAYFIDRRMACGKVPQYTFLVSIMAGLLFIAAFGGRSGWFGDFGGPHDVEPNYELLAILCLVCGIQNASITTASGAVIRTTHLTGITTDLGIGLMRAFAKGQSLSVQEKEKKATWMRMGIIFFFILGSTISSFLFYSEQFYGFLLPAGISSFLLLFDLKDRLKKFRKAAHG